jgi:hypothetical protein
MKTEQLLNTIPLVQNPELIRVMALSKKIADQLHTLKDEYNGKVIEWDNYEIVGAYSTYSRIIVRDRNSF